MQTRSSLSVTAKLLVDESGPEEPWKMQKQVSDIAYCLLYEAECPLCWAAQSLAASRDFDAWPTVSAGYMQFAWKVSVIRTTSPRLA